MAKKNNLKNEKIPQSVFPCVIGALADWVLVIENSTHKWVFSNNAVEKILGYKPQEIVGQNTMDSPIIPLESRKIIKNNWAPLLTKGFLSNIEIDLIHKNGKIIPVSYSESVLKDKKGQIKYRIVVVRNITKAKRLREDLEKKISELEAFQKIVLKREVKMIELKQEIERLKEGKKAE